MPDKITKREAVARAIYATAFDVSERRNKPSPGWCWDKTSQQMRDFCLKQADAAIEAYERHRS